jgi:hypothetical protein
MILIRGGNIKMSKLTIEYINIDELIPYINNPRINDNAVDVVAASIKEFGFKNPILIDRENVIIAGHTRLKAAKKLGLKEVPTIKVEDLTDEQVKALRLVDNKTGELAEWDWNVLEKELAELEFEFGSEKLESMGFELECIDLDEFGTEFALPEGEQGEMRTMSFQLHVRQKETIEYALGLVEDGETFGNKNKNGNALYGVVSEWLAQRK